MDLKLKLILFFALLAFFYFWKGSGNNNKQNSSTHLPCKQGLDFEKALLGYANTLDGTPYSVSKQTDCSGMFHKFLNLIRKDCSEAHLPTINKARSSRDIAHWYYKHGNFKIIRNPLEEDYQIRPGMVMFYGYGNRNGKYNRKNLDIGELTTRGKGVNHVAVVTKVILKDGAVDSYEIFHGRNPKYPAGVTGSQRVPYQKNMPIYGNGTEPWLAVAEMFGHP